MICLYLLYLLESPSFQEHMEWCQRKGTPTEPARWTKSNWSILLVSNHPPVLVLSLNEDKRKGLHMRWTERWLTVSLRGSFLRYLIYSSYNGISLFPRVDLSYPIISLSFHLYFIRCEGLPTSAESYLSHVHHWLLTTRPVLNIHWIRWLTWILCL